MSTPGGLGPEEETEKLLRHLVGCSKELRVSRLYLVGCPVYHVNEGTGRLHDTLEVGLLRALLIQDPPVDP